jgi:deoxyribodipyrimidine photo-lyase
VLVWFHSFDLRVHDHAPLAFAHGYTQAFFEHHPDQRRRQSPHDVRATPRRKQPQQQQQAQAEVLEEEEQEAKLLLPSDYAHVLPVYIFDLERWFHRLSLASVLQGPSASAADETAGHGPAKRPLDDDATDITDERIPHPNVAPSPPAQRLEGDELRQATFGYSLDSATAQSKYLSPLSVLRDTTIPKTDIKRAQFLRECVEDLQRNLRSMGSDLLVRVGRTEEVLAELMDQTDAKALYTHTDYATEELEVADAVAKACRERGVKLRCFEGNTLYAQADLPFPFATTTLERLPDVFTPFRSKVEAMGPHAVRSHRPYSISIDPSQLIQHPDSGEDDDALQDNEADNRRRVTSGQSEALPGVALKTLPPSYPGRLSSTVPSLKELGYSAQVLSRFQSAPQPHPNSSFPLRGGETAALAHMHSYIWGPEQHVSHYKDTRNQLSGLSDSSKFSPFLSAGCLSARAIHAQVKLFEQRVAKNTGTQWIIVELLFRDHFRFLAESVTALCTAQLMRCPFASCGAHSYGASACMAHRVYALVVLHCVVCLCLLSFPSSKYGSRIFFKYGPNARSWIRSHKDEVEWRTDVRLFRAWCLGQTGYPFVDACMRELLATGYMSNRGRQVVASFLCHDLKLDWRLGAAWFESQLIDHDVASNYGNWTYQAGVAFDPRSPYRYFNIHKQAQMYDPTGAHVRLWLPELQQQQQQQQQQSTEASGAAGGADASEAPAAASSSDSATAAPATACLPSSSAASSSSMSYPAYPRPIMPLQSEEHAAKAKRAGAGSSSSAAVSAATAAAAASSAGTDAAAAATGARRPTPFTNGASNETAAGSVALEKSLSSSEQQQQQQQQPSQPQRDRGGGDGGRAPQSGSSQSQRQRRGGSGRDHQLLQQPRQQQQQQQQQQRAQPASLLSVSVVAGGIQLLQPPLQQQLQQQQSHRSISRHPHLYPQQHQQLHSGSGGGRHGGSHRPPHEGAFARAPFQHLPQPLLSLQQQQPYSLLQLHPQYHPQPQHQHQQHHQRRRQFAYAPRSAVPAAASSAASVVVASGATPIASLPGAPVVHAAAPQAGQASSSSAPAPAPAAASSSSRPRPSGVLPPAHQRVRIL